MSKKLNQNELFETINSKLTDLSKDQIKTLIQKELEKNADDIDMDYVDFCYELLESNDKSNAESEEKTLSRIKFKPSRILIAAVIIVLLIASTITVSAYVFNFNIPQYIAQIIEGNAQIDTNLENADTTAGSYALTDTYLAQKFAEYGISPVTFPEEMINEDCSIISIENMTTDESVQKDIFVRFEYFGNAGSLSVSQSNADFEWVGEETVMEVNSAEIININGMDILIFEQDGNCSIIYKDHLTKYNISIECDMDTALSFAKSIK
ncbi:MAG TPA: hypothetical protein IAA37_00030 [Candidatus Eubacterium faecale]|uniref:DUF4367 domain-containing protein n=1 Tax=Candidatus Eubacterium faecale TaxID=2838568 RepID=A0A9D2MFU7_9FIRM|nr:hypothetical protein [Candidatus Eubacterium faecale]